MTPPKVAGGGGGGIGPIGGGGGLPGIKPAPYEACCAYACIPENMEFCAAMDCEIHEDGNVIE